MCSGKGGSGKSTVTVGLAAALASAGKRVLCADADISVRSLDLLLETGEDILFNWYDAAKGNCKKKRRRLDDTLYRRFAFAGPKKHGRAYIRLIL